MKERTELQWNRNVAILVTVIITNNSFICCFPGIVALWSLAVLSFERFFVICRPLGNIRLQAKHAFIGLLFVWSFSFIWTVPPVLGWNRYTVSKIGTTCEPDWWVGKQVFCLYCLHELGLCKISILYAYLGCADTNELSCNLFLRTSFVGADPVHWYLKVLCLLKLAEKHLQNGATTWCVKVFVRQQWPKTEKKSAISWVAWAARVMSVVR